MRRWWKFILAGSLPWMAGAGEVGIDWLNADGSAPPAETAVAEAAPKAQALAGFAMALLGEEGGDENSWLLQALANDADARLPLKLLLQQLQQSYPIDEAVIRRLCEIAEANPQALMLNMVALELGNDLEREPLSSERQLAMGLAVWKRLPPDRNWTDAELAEQYVKLIGGLVLLYANQGQFEAGEKLLTDELELVGGSGYRHERLLENAAIFYRLGAEHASDDRGWLGWRDSPRQRYRERLAATLEQLLAEADELKENSALQRLTVFRNLGCDTEFETLVARLIKRPDIVRKADLYTLLAEQRQRAGRFQDACELWKKLCWLFPLEREYRLNLGYAAFLGGDYELAAEQFEWILLLLPKNDGTRQMLIHCCLTLGQYDKAARLNRKIQDEFNRKCTSIEIALWRKSLSKARELLTELEDEAVAAPVNEVFFQRLERVYNLWMALAELQHDTGLAIRICSEMETMGLLDVPRNANNIGYTLAILDIELDKAEKLIRLALAEDREFDVLDSMAMLCLRRGRYREAVDYIEEALALQTERKDGVIYEHAGDIYLAVGKPDLATECYRLALQYVSYGLDTDGVKAKLQALEAGN